MESHDSVRDAGNIFENGDLLKRISPKFHELSLDIQEVYKHSKDPMFLAVLLFKLAEEREKTNRILEKLFDKYDEIMLRLKTAGVSSNEASLTPTPQPEDLSTRILPEQDQMIMHLAATRGQITADDVRAELGYKRANAASQRLNKLFKDGHLRKVQSGRKVLYLAKNL
jgi:predicted HTH transcriptional regulator